MIFMATKMVGQQKFSPYSFGSAINIPDPQHWLKMSTIEAPSMWTPLPKLGDVSGEVYASSEKILRQLVPLILQHVTQVVRHLPAQTSSVK